MKASPLFKVVQLFLEFVGFSLLLSTVVLSCGYCARVDQKQSVRDFLGACPEPKRTEVKP